MTNLPQQINLKIRPLSLITGLLLVLTAFGKNGFCGNETRENRVVVAVRNTSPAVVNISSQYELRKNSSPFAGYGMDPLLEKFFRDFFSPEMERREKRTSLGSGVIIDGLRGYVLTNTHVVDKATTITVALNDKREFEASIVGMDPDSDLAVLKINTDQSLPSVNLGNSDDIMIGESVIAIGNPFGFSHTVTTGVISAVNRSIKTSERIFHKFIQTDASINPGNSGGPLLNIDGELIGINTAIYAQAQGIGFAIPINRANRIIADLIKYGAVTQPWIGMAVQPLNANMAAYLNIQSKMGVMVTSVDMGSPAESAGIEEGDIILAINGTEISDMAVYQSVINDISADQPIRIELNRRGSLSTIAFTATTFPIERALELADQRLGITVADLNQQIRTQYSIPASNGVLIVKIRRDSHLDRIGVAPGDIIRQIDEKRVDNLEDFKAAIVKYRSKSSVVLLIQRQGHIYYINAIMRENG